MKKEKTYYLFLFLSTFLRGLIEIFSLILLYKKGLSLKEIYLFLLISYLIGIITIKITLKYNKKIILILSNIIYGISIIYLVFLKKEILFLITLASLLSFSTYSYHFIRHYYALNILSKKTKPNKIIALIHISAATSSILGGYLLNKISPFIISLIVIILSIIASIPILKYSLNNNTITLKKVKIEKNKIIFSILEQFKIIFLELQPLYLYIFIKKSYLYISTFNIIMTLSSLIVIYIIYQYLKPKHIKYITIILGIILMIKINTNHKYFLLFIAILEGILIKIYDIFSLKNLYDIKNNNINNYLYKEETIFLISKSIIILIYLFLSLKLKTILYINIIGIILSGFFIE